MRRLGKWGFKVPTITFSPSDNIISANCLASRSVGKPFARLGAGARPDVGRHSLGLSTETYQRLLAERIKGQAQLVCSYHRKDAMRFSGGLYGLASIRRLPQVARFI